MLTVAEIQSSLEQVQERKNAAAQRAGRSGDEVRLVVVTKTHPAALVERAIAAGARALGENYAEEGAGKRQALASPAGVEWHMIGHVQSRKARLVCEHFDYLHSLDSLKLAQRLDRCAGELGRRLPVLLEFNVSGEDSKFGWSAWDEAAWPGLEGELEPVTGLANLEVRGLMTMAPFLDDPEQARPYFRRLRRLRDHLSARFPQTCWDELSMGMSADFEVAVEEGATWIRVGTAILARNG